MSTPSPTSTRPSSENWRAWPAPDKLQLLERLRQRTRAGEVLDDLSRFAGDPLALLAYLWPALGLYDRQVEIVQSVCDNRETVVVAANMVGKDYAAAAIALSFFVCPQAYFPPEYVREVDGRRKAGLLPWMVHTRRIVTTSVKDEHIDILWGEVGRHAASSRVAILHTRGGPLMVNYHEIRLLEEMAVKNPLNYLKGQVSQRGEGMAGHHAAYTLFVADEASGVDDEANTQADAWAKRKLIFGNPNPCQNFFRRAVKAGDILAPVSP